MENLVYVYRTNLLNSIKDLVDGIKAISPEIGANAEQFFASYDIAKGDLSFCDTYTTNFLDVIGARKPAVSQEIKDGVYTIYSNESRIEHDYIRYSKILNASATPVSNTTRLVVRDCELGPLLEIYLNSLDKNAPNIASNFFCGDVNDFNFSGYVATGDLAAFAKRFYLNSHQDRLKHELSLFGSAVSALLGAVDNSKATEALLSCTSPQAFTETFGLTNEDLVLANYSKVINGLECVDSPIIIDISAFIWRLFARAKNYLWIAKAVKANAPHIENIDDVMIVNANDFVMLAKAYLKAKGHNVYRSLPADQTLVIGAMRDIATELVPAYELE